jgi:carbamoylphosphate synthase large subunit
MKKKILILAGGTATAWHLSMMIKSRFEKDFILCIGDINKKNLIPASTLSDEYYQLPAITDSSYYSYMLELFKTKNIDIIVPLIDSDLALFPNDNTDLLKINVLSTAPVNNVVAISKSKTNMSELLKLNGVIVPELFNQNTIEPQKDYFVKPDAGFGSKNTGIFKGKDIDFSKKIIVQEILHQPEITVEVFKKEDHLSYICRERLEVKSGVCTKARIFDNEEIGGIINHINTFLKLPLASCIQFMKNKDEQWCLTDFNMRLGAGTALSSAAGFGISSAFLSVLAGQNDFRKYLKKTTDDLFVVRVYNEIIMA